MTWDQETVYRYFSLFSLFGSIWKHLEADCFRYFALFAIWKHLEAIGSWLFSLFWTVLTLKRQISENSQTSKCFQNSPQSLCHVYTLGKEVFKSVALSHCACAPRLQRLAETFQQFLDARRHEQSPSTSNTCTLTGCSYMGYDNEGVWSTAPGRWMYRYVQGLGLRVYDLGLMVKGCGLWVTGCWGIRA